MQLFVPGRICLFGEHSDWAGGYRRSHPEIDRGYAIIAGTNQGVFAEVRPHPSKLIVRSTLDDGSDGGALELPMEQEALLSTAEAGGFFSYIAGVAHDIAAHFEVGGMVIDNHQTTLPVRKGLSSSAAICVLTARAFNRLYHLNLSPRGEMAYAYAGELLTGSQCGRMDQGCAYGEQPILMTFDGDRMEVQPLTLPQPLYFVIADLHATKDTKRILESLNRAFPVAESSLHRQAQTYLGPINARIVRSAVAALQAGDAAQIGALMQEAQRHFDAALQPLCPDQLTAPKLHEVLAYGPIQPYIYGGKGVGSQGDGAVQFIVRDEAAQIQVMSILERELGLTGLRLTLAPASGRARPVCTAAVSVPARTEHPPSVRKAIIPAAGYGTRMFPASRAMRKELFPVISREGWVKPAILVLIEEALAAGIEEIALIVQPGHESWFEALFTPLSVAEQRKYGEAQTAYAEELTALGKRVTLIPQVSQEGFGHAVYCAHEWLSGEPSLLLLGDHLFASSIELSCAAQMMAAYASCQPRQSVVGLLPTPIESSHLYGAATGTWVEPGRLLQVSRFIEKPTPEEVEQHLLRLADLPPGQVLSFLGQYILSPAVFTILARHIEQDYREQGEVQLTACLEALL
ncbi:MAG: GHMP kinase [Candidatus Entotheonella factor]|uniref:UTP--glucose-1-phosphate uridylyltransferase n=2 Tax=Candidatus Entotheonella TaxID=93171 RepID=W4LSX5_ENTF1|nr:MAG: GHMP kinase [Candidatus Entotheonella factor]